MTHAHRRLPFVLAAMLVGGGPCHLRAAGIYARWRNGPPDDPGFFPIGVWLQSTDPARIAQYQAAGFNLYIGLWRGPTEAQLANLKAAGVRTICAQTPTGLNSPNRDIIVGWMHDDEPDNAQWNDQTKSYDPPVLPDAVLARYDAMKAADPTRPVYLNLGQGVAWDGWWGRGTRTNHPEDYPLYLKACDIGSFDIYPYAAPDDDARYAPVHDKPWLIASGVDRMIGWIDPERQLVWNFVECTNIHGHGEATPLQVRAEVWMSLIHGSRGICYFVHEFEPFVEAGLLADPVMTAAVTAINDQIRRLAPVLNSPAVPGPATVESANPDVPVDVMAKRHEGQLYLFAVAMRDAATTATFTVPGLSAGAAIEVIDEDRTISARAGAFQDAFDPLGVHLYRVAAAQTSAVAAWEAASRAEHRTYPY